jgi:predicted DNA-binding WGR domain protein
VVRTLELFFCKGKSDKVYRVQIEVLPDGWFTVNAYYGRRGAKLRRAPQGTFEDPGEAQTAFAAIILKKAAKGYEVVDQCRQSVPLVLAVSCANAQYVGAPTFAATAPQKPKTHMTTAKRLTSMFLSRANGDVAAASALADAFVAENPLSDHADDAAVAALTLRTVAALDAERPTITKIVSAEGYTFGGTSEGGK